MILSEKNKLFKKYYDDYVQSLFSYAYYQCGDRGLAEDVIQDVFAKFWEKIDNVEKDKVKNYLYRATKNLLINHSQHQKVVLKFESQIDEDINRDSPHYQLEVNEFKVRLERAIAELPDGQREVFLMHRIDGLKYKEIAEILGVGQKAIEKRMHLALKHLRTLSNKI